jgi:hypothetical protein
MCSRPHGVSVPAELVGADRVGAGSLDEAAAFVAALLRSPGGDIRVAEGQLELQDEVVVAGHPDDFSMSVLEPADPGVVWAVDGGSTIVADGKSFQVAATRAARVRFERSVTTLVEQPPLDVMAVSAARIRERSREVMADLGATGDSWELPDGVRPVDALREWSEWREVRRTIRDAARGDLILVDGSLHGGPAVPPDVVRLVHREALERGVGLAGVVKASTLYWGRNAPLVGLLKRRGDRELGVERWVARISEDPVFARLYVGEIFVAHLAPTAPHAFRVDVASGGPDPVEVLARLAGCADDPAFVGYPYPLARAHQAARVTGYAVADVRRAFRDALAGQGMSEEDIELLFQDFHEVLNRS